MDTASIGRSSQMAFDTIIPRDEIEARYGESIGGNTKEMPESVSNGFDVTSQCADWDKWRWDTATGLSVEQVREKLTSSSLDTSDWLITGCDSKASRHLMVQAAQAGCTVYLKPYLTLEFEAHDHTTFEPRELPVQSTLPEPMADVASEPSAWKTAITQWLAANNKTETSIRELVVDCLQLPETERTGTAQIEVARALRSLGWASIGQKRRGGVKVAMWTAPK